jgi:lipopolysaccharide transport system permease protein
VHSFAEHPPVISIGATPPPLTERLRELWRYRELLFFLAWRDIKVRYRQTVLGILWAMLQPLLMMLLFTVVFGRLGRMPSEGVPYALFAYVGLLPWTFFSHAVTEGGNSLITYPDLVTKVYLPRLLVPGAAIAAALVDFAIGFVLLVGLLVWYGVAPTFALLLLPVLVALTAVLAFAVGSWMAALNVRYRDVRYALPFAIQLWLFATPVIYPSTLVPDRWRPLLLANPLTGIIDGFRTALLGRPLDGTGLLVSALLTALAVVLSLRYFRAVEQDFADAI